MPVDHTDSYPAAPDEVLAVLTDEEFLRGYATVLRATARSVRVTREGARVRTEVEMAVPTTGIPDLFARFVGREVVVTDTRTWTPDGDGGWRGEFAARARIFGRDTAITGTTVLTPTTGSLMTTTATTTADASVDAPVVGRQAEGAVRELALVVQRREAELLHRRLGGAAD